jgi:hypothetical protein
MASALSGGVGTPKTNTMLRSEHQWSGPIDMGEGGRVDVDA